MIDELFAHLDSHCQTFVEPDDNGTWYNAADVGKCLKLPAAVVSPCPAGYSVSLGGPAVHIIPPAGSGDLLTVATGSPCGALPCGEDHVSMVPDALTELESVAPERLQNILRDAIDRVLGIAAFNAEIGQERHDAAHLDRVRRS